MMEIRRSDARGHANHGWLDSHHSFSFASYYDQRFMGFGPLRVINEDRVLAKRGFGKHPHRNMEIISYVVEGELAHEDTLGNGSIIRPGEVQLMSAGSGIAHSEMNRTDRPVHFLQIWIEPSVVGTAPGYQQRDFGEQDGLVLVVSPDGRDGSLTIKADADLLRLRGTESARYALKRPRGWVQVVRGELHVNGAVLHAGDGLAVTDATELKLEPQGAAEALVFDLRE